MKKRLSVFLFVGSALVGLCVFVLFLKGGMQRAMHRVWVDFSYCGSLQTGASIHWGGVRIGRVGSMNLLTPESVPKQDLSDEPSLVLGQQATPVLRVEMLIDDDASRVLHQRCVDFSAAMSGLVGDMIVELDLSARDANTPCVLFWKGEEARRGFDAPHVYRMALQMESLLQELLTWSAVLHDVQQALVVFTERSHDPKMQTMLSQNAQTITALLQELHLTLKDGRPHMQQILKKIPHLLEQTQQTLAVVQTLGQKFERTIDRRDLDQLFDHLESATASSAKIGHDVEALLSKVQRGEGSLGGLLNDSQMYEDLRGMVRDLRHNPWKVLWRK